MQNGVLKIDSTYLYQTKSGKDCSKCLFQLSFLLDLQYNRFSAPGIRLTVLIHLHRQQEMAKPALERPPPASTPVTAGIRSCFYTTSFLPAGKSRRRNLGSRCRRGDNFRCRSRGCVRSRRLGATLYRFYPTCR